MGAVKRTHPESVFNQKGDLKAKKWLRRLKITNQKGKIARVMLKLEKWDYQKTDFKRKYPNRSHSQSKMLKSIRMSYKHYRLHEKELDAYCAFLDDMIINGTSGKAAEPVGLISHSIIPQPKVRPIVFTTNCVCPSPVIFDEMREYFKNFPEWPDYKNRMLDGFIVSQLPNIVKHENADPLDAIRYGALEINGPFI